MAEAELPAEYSRVVHEDVLAAIAYGAGVPRERVIPVPIGRVASREAPKKSRGW